MQTWKQVEKKCREVGMGFAVAVDRFGKHLLRDGKRQAYTPGGALDVIAFDTRTN